MTAVADEALARLVREERSRLVATLARATGDLDLAEDAVQDALAAAATAWPRNGVPTDPAPWIFVVARRRAIDRLRRSSRTVADPVALERLEATASSSDAEGELPDERLELMFGCCHPALALESQVALTLRCFGGLTTAQIAAAFHVAEETMAQRIVRAKRKVRDSGIPFAIPTAGMLPARRAALLGVVYLIFNEGYAASGIGPRVSDTLCDDAIALGRLLAVLMPDEPEVLGLAALMLFHDARRSTRTDAAGLPVPLDDQDRTRWDQRKIAEGDGLLERALAIGTRGPYLIQACIAALHAQARAAAATDWRQIAELYRALSIVAPSPSVELAYAGALAMAQGPEVGLAMLEELRRRGWDGAPGRLATVRGEMLRRAGRSSEAAEAYRAALRSGLSEQEHAFVRARIAGLADTEASD